MAENSFADGVVAGMATNSDRMPYGGGFGGFGYGGDWIWIILLFALFGNGGFGFGGGNALGYDFPWLLNGQNSINNNTNNNFRDTAISSKLDSISAALCNNATESLRTAYENQIAGMNQSFAMQQAFSNCCCENRLGTADLKATVLAENCADRALLSDGIRDVIVSQNANTQKILDQMCQDKIDSKNEKIADLERQLTMANLSASQTAQTAQLMADNIAQTQTLIARIAPYPIPSYTVGNPYGYYNNGSNCGCGCGNGNV